MSKAFVTCSVYHGNIFALTHMYACGYIWIDECIGGPENVAAGERAQGAYCIECEECRNQHQLLSEAVRNRSGESTQRICEIRCSESSTKSQFERVRRLWAGRSIASGYSGGVDGRRSLGPAAMDKRRSGRTR